MARQNSNPPPWNESMSDGCSAFVLKLALWPFKKYCLLHDEAYHYGGTQAWQKDQADSTLYWNIRNHSWYGRLCAYSVYNAVRWGTYNYPPRHPLRSSRKLTKTKAWNWRLTTEDQREELGEHPIG
jgi:hypothetical protein